MAEKSGHLSLFHGIIKTLYIKGITFILSDVALPRQHQVV